MSNIEPGRFTTATRTLVEVANYAQMYGVQEDTWLIQKFGENRDIDSGVIEDVWSYGGIRPKPGAAELFNIVSSNANDTAAGTGCRLLLIQGLDAEYNLQEEYVSMNGTTPVQTVNTYRNIHRMLSGLVGSTEGNVGQITATGEDSSDVMAAIPTTYNITQMSHFMIPKGYTGYIMDLTASVYKADGSGSRNGEVSLYIQIPNFAEFRTEVYGLQSGTVSVNYEAGIRVREKSLIWLEALCGSNNTSVSGQYQLLMIRNDWVTNP
jgi:hypothetical protein